MDGGAPAGIINPPGEDGCRTISTIINIMTIHGNRSTAPSGIEIFELPFSRMRLLKNDNLGMNRSFSSVKSVKEGRDGVDGSRLIRFPPKPMVATNPAPQAPRRWGRGGDYVSEKSHGASETA